MKLNLSFCIIFFLFLVCNSTSLETTGDSSSRDNSEENVNTEEHVTTKELPKNVEGRKDFTEQAGSQSHSQAHQEAVQHAQKLHEKAHQQALSDLEEEEYEEEEYEMSGLEPPKEGDMEEMEHGEAEESDATDDNIDPVTMLEQLQKLLNVKKLIETAKAESEETLTKMKSNLAREPRTKTAPSPETHVEYPKMDLVHEANKLRKLENEEDMGQSISMFEEASEGGNPHAMLALGQIYLYGEGGIEQDHKKAFTSFNESASYGLPEAQQGLAFMYNTGNGVSLNIPKGLLYNTFASFGGDQIASLTLGYQHFYGHNMVQSCPKAVAKFAETTESLIEDVHDSHLVFPLNYHRLGDELQSKEATSDEEDLIQFYKYTAATGEIQSQVTLGNIYLQGGYGVTKDYSEAFKYFELAAAQEDPGGMSHLGFMYANGYGVKQSYEKALTYFEAAAKAGHPHAQTQLGLMHLKGIIFPKDPTAAIAYFNKAAEQGYLHAQLQLGHIWYDGNGVSIDYRRAFQYYSLAAHQGHLVGINNWAKMHYLGIGTVASCSVGVHLFKRVVESSSFVSDIMKKAYSYYQIDDWERALVYYEKAGQMGVEVAQSNAAYILDMIAEEKLEEEKIAGKEQPTEMKGEENTEVEDNNMEETKGQETKGHENKGAEHKGQENEVQENKQETEGQESELEESNGEGNKGEEHTGEGNNGEENNRVENKGEGQPKEEKLSTVALKKALKYYQDSAEQQSADSHLKIGDFYYYGKGAKVDHAKAVAYYYAASNLNHPQAMFNMGYMHQFGKGLPQDLHLAKKHYDLAYSTHTEAFFPVMLALGGLGLQFAYNYLFIKPISFQIFGVTAQWDTIVITMLASLLVGAVLVRQRMMLDRPQQ